MCLSKGDQTQRGSKAALPKLRCCRSVSIALMVFVSHLRAVGLAFPSTCFLYGSEIHSIIFLSVCLCEAELRAAVSYHGM